MNDNPTNWEVFKGDHILAPDRIQQLPPPPPWRQFRKPVDPDLELTPEQQDYQTTIDAYWQQLQTKAASDENNRDRRRGESFRIRQDQARVVQSVNAALALRRPLLITGRPGSGKTSLAYAIAHELQLGQVLMWPITARTTLEVGLYRYDAIARLQDAQLRKQKAEAGESNIPPERNIGDYIQLGPLGTAFLPTRFPRVLLIDEVDKSDINLPNDLLNLLEEGQFEIPELVRLSESEAGQENKQTQPIQVRTADDLKVAIEGGKIRCDAFPLIIMTSNGERDFPPAFLRRCLRIEMPKPIDTDLYNIVEAHLTKDVADRVNDLISRFLEKTDSDAALLATDQLLNAVYLRKYGAQVEKDGTLEDLLLKALTSTGGE
jgi:MoxR-like ATPase